MTTLMLVTVAAFGLSVPSDPVGMGDRSFRQCVQLRSKPGSEGYAPQVARGAADWYRSAIRYEPNVRISALERSSGHAYFLAGDLPSAIAAYRRGLASDPADEKLRTALKYARDQVAYPPGDGLRPSPDLWPPWLSLRYVGLYAFSFYFAGCLAATRWRMTRSRRWLVAAGVLLAAAAVPAVGSLLEWRQERRDAHAPVVVVLRDLPLRAGNGVDYPAKLDLPRGCEVRGLFERGEWLQVETAGGTVGWLPQDAVVNTGGTP